MRYALLVGVSALLVLRLAPIFAAPTWAQHLILLDADHIYPARLVIRATAPGTDMVCANLVDGRVRCMTVHEFRTTAVAIKD